MTVSVERIASIIAELSITGCTKEDCGKVLTAMGRKPNPISQEEALAVLAEIKNPPKELGKLYCKVSEKGGLSVYGLQRMPVTLYVEQWERLLGFSGDVKAFIAANNGKLKRETAEQRKARKDADKAKAAAPPAADQAPTVPMLTKEQLLAALAQLQAA